MQSSQDIAEPGNVLPAGYCMRPESGVMEPTIFLSSLAAAFWSVSRPPVREVSMLAMSFSI